jgi:tetratricopeptide (TPR) repeat protein/4-amino-4-deoxy-L-arabinose transferase-like glycosyltransferase
MGVLLQLKPPHRTVLAIALVGAVAALLTWLCVRDPKIAFLVGDGRAEWILFPSAQDVVTHPIADLDAVFRREFTLAGQPRAAQLSVRAAKRVQLKINGREVEMGISRNWKDFYNVDVPGYLHAGTNTIEARVFNDNAPPALWLVLATDRFTLRSDQIWETSFGGSAWHRAVLATKPRIPGRGNPMAGGEETLTALAVVWPIWVGFGGLSIAVWMAGRWWLNRIRVPKVNVIGRWLSNEAVVPLLIVAVLWVALYCNNARSIPCAAGFDAHYHADYIGYIQKHRALPLPNEGLEMFQPPLYYGISAVTLSSFGLSVTDEAAGTVLHLFTMLFGIAHFTLVFLSLRLLFPAQISRQLVGLVLAAFLPMQLYLSHYVTNETLAATLVTATIFLCLRLVRTKKASVAGYAGLGFCLGAALLTKVTGFLMVPFIVVAAAWKLAELRSAFALWWRTLGVMVGTCFIVCGWYYFWIWFHCGTPLARIWDVSSQFQWWQDNGYHTSADFMRFGRSLVHPLFSGFAGFADGIYSTLWGDGLCGGGRSMNYWPPWNYDLMTAGYLLALIPTLIILAGVAVSVWRFIRQPSMEWFMLLGFSGTLLLALVFMNLKAPCYSEEKAFFGLCTLVPLCSFGAVGWEVLTRGWKPLRFVLGTILLVWAMNSFAAVWIRGNSVSTHVYLGAVLDSNDRTDAALSEFARAVDIDPFNAPARRFLALILNKSGKTDEALQQAERAVELDPTNAAGHYILSVILAGQGQIKHAIGEAQRAAELGPEDLLAHQHWSELLFRLRRDDEVINAARNGLAMYPCDPGLHYTLGLALARKNDLTTATNQFVYALLLQPDLAEAHLSLGRALVYLGDTPNGLRQMQEAVRLAPDWPPALNRLAWLLATYPDVTVRNGPEAVRLAEHACAVASRRNPALLDTLAAAYAETGRFPKAINAAQEALALARTTGDGAAAARAENLLECFQSGRPFRENPIPSP